MTRRQELIRLQRMMYFPARVVLYLLKPAAGKMTVLPIEYDNRKILISNIKFSDLKIHGGMQRTITPLAVVDCLTPESCLYAIEEYRKKWGLEDQEEKE